MNTEYKTINVYPQTKEEIKFLCDLLGKTQAEVMFEIFHAFWELCGDFKKPSNMTISIKKYEDFLAGRLIFEFEGSRKVVSGSFRTDTLESNSKVDRKIRSEAEKSLNQKRDEEK